MRKKVVFLIFFAVLMIFPVIAEQTAEQAEAFIKSIESRVLEEVKRLIAAGVNINTVIVCGG